MSDDMPSRIADGRDDLPFMVHSQLDDLDLNPFEFRVYAHMVRRAGNGQGKGEHWESVIKSAKHCRMDPKTYRAALQGLVERRLVTREDRAGQTSVYRLTSPKTWRPLPNTAGVRNGEPLPHPAAPPLPETAGEPLPHPVDKGNPLKVIPLKETSSPPTPSTDATPTAPPPKVEEADDLGRSPIETLTNQQPLQILARRDKAAAKFLAKVADGAKWRYAQKDEAAQALLNDRELAMDALDKTFAMLEGLQFPFAYFRKLLTALPEVKANPTTNPATNAGPEFAALIQAAKDGDTNAKHNP